MLIQDNEQGRNIVEHLVSNKMLYSGISIILIILYHAFSTKVSSVKLFYPGFIGVDIFMFLSGFGLCFSYVNRPLKEFYRRRLLRVLPCYLILAMTVTVIEFALHMVPISIQSAFYNLSTLQFWGFGERVFDWYVSWILVLYLLFPIFYKVAKKVNHSILMGGVILTLLTCFPTLNLPWQFECALGRLPIFLLGICTYQNRQSFYRGATLITLT